MSEAPDSSPLPAAAPAPAIQPKGRPTFMEDMIVTGFGFATSSAVAYGCWAAEHYGHTAIYTWMANFILPVGAVLCGLVAATGYWIGARLFNHRPSRSLLINIVLVSLGTYFSIHYLNYTMSAVNGVTIDKLMSFSDYLVRVTEHMAYKSSHGGEATELGKLGWGVAALQIIGFSIGGFVVYGSLVNVPYCDRCGKYLSQKQTQSRKSKDPAALKLAFNETTNLVQQGQPQQAIQAHAALSKAGVFGAKAISTIEIRKCPCCPLRRFKATLSERNGNQWTITRKGEFFTEEPLTIG